MTAVYQAPKLIAAAVKFTQRLSLCLIVSTGAITGYLGYQECVVKKQFEPKNILFLGVLTLYGFSAPCLLYFRGIKPLVVRVLKQQNSTTLLQFETTNFWGTTRIHPYIDLTTCKLSHSRRVPGFVNAYTANGEWFVFPTLQGFTNQHVFDDFTKRITPQNDK